MSSRVKALAAPVRSSSTSSGLSPLRLAPGGRYFQTAEGEPFLFIGANDAITWPGLSGLYRRRNLPGVEKYLDNLAAHGVNTLRLMLEYAHVDGRYFERRAGTFNPEMVCLWDDLFALCEERGLRVLLAPWDNFWMARRWHKHPYNALNGGPSREPGDFFSHQETIALIEKRLLFVARRWPPGAFAAWDLFNEIHPHWGGSPREQSAVLSRWSHAIRQAEIDAWGASRPQTVSIFGPDPQNGYEEMIFRHPDLDFSTTHIYHQEAIDHPRNTVAPALSMAHWTRHGLANTPPNRPFTDSEHGPIALFNNERKYLPEEFDDEYERHLMWAHLACGGAGSGMRWPARHPHILTPGMLRALKSMRDFLPALNWNLFTPRAAEADAEIEGPQGDAIHIFASRDDSQALVWLLRGVEPDHQGTMPQREAASGLRLCLRGLASSTYEAVFWNTLAGKEEGRVTSSLGRDQTLRLELPDFHNDLAIAVRSY